MTGELRYRKDLFSGTAEHYERFRPPYPPALLDDLRARVPLDGAGRLLDLACGTGQVAFPLAPHVTEVWAVDQEAEPIELGRRKARRLGLGNIRCAFESDLRRRLLACRPDGVFVQDATFAYGLARRGA